MLSVLLSVHSSVLSLSTWNNIQTYENFGVNSFYYAEKEAFRQTTQCFVSIKSLLVSWFFFFPISKEEFQKLDKKSFAALGQSTMEKRCARGEARKVKFIVVIKLNYRTKLLYS